MFKFDRSWIVWKYARAVPIALLLGVSLCGCVQTTQQSQLPSDPTATTPARTDKKVVLATFTVLADMARNVAGDKVIVEIGRAHV